jgi:hypothetical protein
MSDTSKKKTKEEGTEEEDTSNRAYIHTHTHSLSLSHTHTHTKGEGELSEGQSRIQGEGGKAVVAKAAAVWRGFVVYFCGVSELLCTCVCM